MTGPDWDALAPSYDRQLWLERRALRTLLALLSPARDEDLLDVGTGTGALLAELAGRRTRPACAIGIDSSAAMVARAPALPGGWRLERGDARALPYPDASFDCVTAAYLLHVLDAEARRGVIAEIARVVRPRGRVATVTIAPPAGPVAQVLTAPLRAAARRSRGRLAGLRPLDPAPELAAAGLAERTRRRTLAGYPSLCIVAESSAAI